MRNYVITLCISLFCFGASQAQRSIRLGYVDMNYILENVPEYKEAQAQLDQRVAGWKNEIEKRNKEIDQMKKTLDNERVLLTQELIKEREDEIRFMQNEILEYQQKRFGPEGDLMKQRSILVQPIQDQVFNAVQEIAKARQYDFVLDRSSELVMLYADKKHDISDQILLSIKRSSKRNQINSRTDKQELEETEALTLDQVEEREEREAEANAKQTERERLIAERKATRDSIQAAKKAEFEARRQKLLDERQRRRDSILEARQKIKDSIN
ncbi:periplasmic chaperone for outer membrane proteins Skp [Leeuwenhoekiella aestuarii]|uniref:Periplasmic chaperone for outer membrane proteins Skp n=1 Tax=Leeuwenhoekiella aestuarii TaxID=2249426 RepID=A0A4Q0NT67_9FLAO|nr:OmpH family outer membrane protein [Leeuwenhoekiella aestuarii]RXG14086.1 periplasmic chaperone for outer membrane proteins Skp [Leeuwenhoekiella aestuarii]RXG18835.1 periplasmic chaperone for outer membrane proteins Skp [Leeuwenhoekiella aestuarii]